jgi:hypothetical protein
MKFKVDFFAPQKAEETLADTSGQHPCHLRQRSGQLSLATSTKNSPTRPTTNLLSSSYTLLILFMRSLEHLLGQAQNGNHVE